MRVEFKNTKLKKRYERIKEGERAWGKEVARRYVERINVLKVVRQLEDLETLPQLHYLHYHPLTANRMGQHAISITGKMRLIFTVHGEERDVIRIEEVSPHYGD